MPDKNNGNAGNPHGKGHNKAQDMHMRILGATLILTVISVFILFLMPQLIRGESSNVAQRLQAGSDGSSQDYGGEYSIIKLKVDIPCPGHGPLIVNELKKLDGVIDVAFGYTLVFGVTYDSSRISKQQILAAPIFRTYKAREIQ